ncbi:hypothetical protein [Mycobacterium sp.]|uniref:hypothetical protein n=1 Tax=Mycobacterium sp. TaxID=1785 RepID=UPI003F951BAB
MFTIPADSVYAGVEFDISITVTFRGVAVRITGRDGGDIMAEANDLDSVDEAMAYVARELGRVL